MTRKKYPCEECKKELSSGVTFDLVKDDWIYHRYCKDCIRPQVKELFEKLGRPELIPDEPRNFPQYKELMSLITFNVESLLTEKMNTDPEFRKKTMETMEKVMGGKI